MKLQVKNVTLNNDACEKEKCSRKCLILTVFDQFLIYLERSLLW